MLRVRADVAPRRTAHTTHIIDLLALEQANLSGRNTLNLHANEGPAARFAYHNPPLPSTPD